MIVRIALLLVLGSSFAVAQPTLEAVASAKTGADVSITVGGNDNPLDFLTIVAKGSREGAYDAYQYARKPGVIILQAPAAAGDYEIRLLGAASPYPTLVRRALKVEAAAATLDAPAQVAAGAKFQVKWTGPNNALDYIGMGDSGHPYLVYVYTREGSPVTLTAPDKTGDYELRYFIATGDAVIHARKITVGGVSASVSPPAEAVAGETFKVEWKGPNNTNDYITIIPTGTREGTSGNYAYTARGNPASVLAPLTPGDYELRYSTGQSHATLARGNIRITPGKQEPGLVTASVEAATPTGSAVEIILDASGSMLQKIGAQRRIDIAKQTLTHLTSSNLPAGTPFALRVFGREVDSCQTDLDIPLGPLHAPTVAGKIAALEAKNNAKTPIGASLEKVIEDLATVKGERLVILLTDGEETCGGDAAAAIGKLKKAGVSTRVNIVGFAIDDQTLAATFRHWSESGNGSYFNAKDAAGLASAMSQALRPGFEVVSAQGQVVADGIAGGEPVRVMPGNYTVRLKGQAAKALPVVVKAKETAKVSF